MLALSASILGSSATAHNDVSMLGMGQGEGL